MLSGEPLMDDASIRDLNEGIGCHVTSTLEQTLLLPRDMVELQDLRKNEIFQNTKRYLGMVWCKLPTVVFLFFFFKLIITMNICTLFICYGTNHPPFFSRLSKIFLGSRRSPTPITSSWMRRGKEGLQLCRL